MALPTMTITLIVIPKLFKCVVLAHLCHQNEIFSSCYLQSPAIKNTEVSGWKLVFHRLLLTEAWKEDFSKFFHLGWDNTQGTWKMAVYWSFGKNFSILSIRWCKQRLAVKQILWVRRFLWVNSVSSRREAFIFNKLPEHEYLHWTDFFSIWRHAICR